MLLAGDELIRQSIVLLVFWELSFHNVSLLLIAVRGIFGAQSSSGFSRKRLV
jgi:hypothetical protein